MLSEMREQLIGAKCLTGEAIIVDVKDLETAILLWLTTYCITPVSITENFKNYLNGNSHNHYYQLTPSSFE